MCLKSLVGCQELIWSKDEDVLRGGISVVMSLSHCWEVPSPLWALPYQLCTGRLVAAL